MKLVSFTVRNFRSITDAYKLPLRGFAVFVGPNNEGKSNVLKAIVMALNVLARSEIQTVKGRPIRYRYASGPRMFRYVWRRDFPMSLQAPKPDGRSEFTLEFEFTDDELEQFRDEVKTALATNLKLKLSLGPEDAKLEVLIQGKGKKYLTARSAKIARFVADRLDIQYIPAIRPSDLALEVVNELVDRELMKLEADDEYKALIGQIAAAQTPLLDALGEELTATVSGFIPEVHTIKLETRDTLGRAIRRAGRVFVDDGCETELDMKGDGIKSLTAISLIRHTSQQSLGGRSLILAVEEPESHLHPRAIHRLREVLLELSGTVQVVLTTHSPLLIDRAEVGRNIIVKQGRAAPATKISQIREALGVEVSDNLTSANVVLLVEGETDIIMLNTWLSALSDTLKRALANGTLALDSLGGGLNLRYKASLYKSLLCNVIAFLDNDEAATTAIGNALNADAITDGEYLQAVRSNMRESEIEDLIDPSVYRDEVKREFAVSLQDKFLKATNKKWAQRIRSNFEDGGKAWSAALSRRLKILVARSVEGIGLQSLADQHRGPVMGLVELLESRLPPT